MFPISSFSPLNLHQVLKISNSELYKIEDWTIIENPKVENIQNCNWGPISPVLTVLICSIGQTMTGHHIWLPVFRMVERTNLQIFLSITRIFQSGDKKFNLHSELHSSPVWWLISAIKPDMSDSQSVSQSVSCLIICFSVSVWQHFLLEDSKRVNYETLNWILKRCFKKTLKVTGSS